MVFVAAPQERNLSFTKASRRPWSFHRFTEEYQCRFAIQVLRDVAFQHLAFVIYCLPKIVHLSVDLHENLVQMLLRVRKGTHPIDTLSTDFGGKHRAKSVTPEMHGFVANVDLSLVQQVFYISQRKWKLNTQHNRHANDLGAAVETPNRVTFCHGWTLQNQPAPLNSNPSDSTG